MWRKIAKYFNSYPKRRKLAQKLLEYGLKVSDNKIYCGEIELSDSKIARAFDVDRRIIAETIKTINDEKDLQKVFFQLRPTCHLKDVATEMVNLCHKKGLVIITCGKYGNTIRLLMPLIIDDEDLERGFKIMEENIQILENRSK